MKCANPSFCDYRHGGECSNGCNPARSQGAEPMRAYRVKVTGKGLPAMRFDGLYRSSIDAVNHVIDMTAGGPPVGIAVIHVPTPAQRSCMGAV